MPSRLILAALLVGLPASPPPESDIVERVLAVVDRRPVLLTEVHVVGALKKISDDLALDVLIDEMLMYAEARRYPQAQPTAAEEAAALESLRSTPGSGLAPQDLLRIAHREATILKYVALRFRPLIHVSDSALRTTYDTASAGSPAGTSFDEAAPRLREQLVERELSTRIEDWARQLRAAADIRYVDVETGSRP
jgi:hypothetical protein